jgi:SAM-dependent methyltransferase
MPTSDDYFASRLTADKRRTVLWQTLCKHFFSKLIGDAAAVLDLGAGYCDFINHVKARKRFAVDRWSGIRECAQDGVEFHVGELYDLDWIQDSTLEFAFASNVFEHLSQEDFAKVLQRLQQKLAPGGRLCILQPNYRYCSREYFDDYTHISVYSHISLCDFLTANGFTPIECHPRFLPLTIKSHLPVWPLLIRLYLLLPIKPRGKQMLVVATPAPTHKPRSLSDQSSIVDGITSAEGKRP